MNGHDRRRQRITDRIKRTALELFVRCGVERVSMDEIAAGADVSKVTIYKYFGSKEELLRQVMDLYVDETLAATEALLASELDFFEKLKFVLADKLNARAVTEDQTLIELLEKNGPASSNGKPSLKDRIQEIMFRFYAQGKAEGYIEEGIPFELLYLYSEIFEAGFKAKSMELKPVLADPQAFNQLLHIYFFGVFRKR